jgi:endonuclease/exonuclease/phosphatase (EEP) superfamily protein YafD
MLKWLTRLLDCGIALHGIIVTTLLLVRRSANDRQPLIGFFNVFAQLLTLAGLVLLPFTLLRRSWGLVLTQLIPAGFFLLRYGPQFRPRRSIPLPHSRCIRVMTFNLHKEEAHIDLIIALIRQARPDILAVQELRPGAAACFETELDDLLPHRALHPRAGRAEGQGVLSRYPIVADEYWRNPHISSESLGHQRVVIDIEGVSVTLYNTHPIHPGMGGRWFADDLRGKEIDVVLAKAGQDSAAVLIMGDFNMTDTSDDYRRITADFGDTFGEVGQGLGFSWPDIRLPQALPDNFSPVPLPTPPLLRLDYIFHSPSIQALEARVWPDSAGSDHRPLLATLTLINPVADTQRDSV